jgi:hypothetical protein
MGLTLPQTYRYVLLPMAFRIVIPPLTSESMNIVKNSSVAFAVSIAELTMFAMQAQEETSRGIEIYLAVTGCCTSSPPSPSTASPGIEQRVQVPGMIGGGGRANARLRLPQLGVLSSFVSRAALLAPAHAGGDGRRHRAGHRAGADAPVRQALAGDAGGGLRQHHALASRW